MKNLLLSSLLGILGSLLFVSQAAAQDIEPASETSDSNWPGSYMGYGAGAEVSLGGQRSLYNVEGSYQLLRYLQVGASYGYNGADSSNTTGGVDASATAKLNNFMLVARAMPFQKHNPIVEVGLGLSMVSLGAEGSNSQQSLTYDFSGNAVMASAGAGYGYRSDFGLIVSVIYGHTFTLSESWESSVTTSGPFIQSDDEMKTELDEESTGLLESRAYLRLALGMVF